MRYRIPLLAALAFESIAAAATPAAAITCEGNFQVQRSGARVATPYCADENLASVAREYGVRISAHQMRYNTSEKERVCRFIGDDNRVRDTCASYRDDSPNVDPWENN